jgi:DNA-binding NarL/FixJ family response regulator
VLTAKSGSEVVDRLHQQRNEIDIVIMDMVMPDIGPEQILQAVQDHNPRAKVVLSSGYDLGTAANQSLLYRTDGFLQKPYRLNELAQVVQATLKAGLPACATG